MTADNLPPKLVEVAGTVNITSEMDIPPNGIDLNRAMENMERKLIVRALEMTGGNRSRAARLLGITFRSLRYRLIKLGMDQEDSLQ